MKERKWYQTGIFMLLCILINLTGKIIAKELELPVWFDAIGTAFAAYSAGPVVGAVVGASVNIVSGFFKYTSWIYSLTSITVGVVVGICAKKGMYKDLFGAMTTAIFVTLASVAVSTPLNVILFGGSTNNKWGDGVIGLFRELGFPDLLAFTVGEFYIDFLDKLLTMIILYAAIKLLRLYRERKKDNSDSPRKLMSVTLAFLLCGALLPEKTAFAAETDNFDSYTKTIFNNAAGLPGGVANDVAMTHNGVLWIGTYNGLYRFSGTDFERPESFDELANVNCLLTDSADRLWIGTNDNGIAVGEEETLAAVLNEDNGLPSNSVRCVGEGFGGEFYVGTSDSLAIVSMSGGAHVERVIEEITYAESISVREDGFIAVVTNDGILYLLRDNEIILQRSCERTGASYTCCDFSPSGDLYLGTTGNIVEVAIISENSLVKSHDVICTNLSNIKSVNFIDTESAIVCSDKGAGRIYRTEGYVQLNTGKFTSSLDHCLVDFQGNVWFTSSRQGLLRLCRSAFTDIYETACLNQQVVNSTIKWNDIFYYATDKGLDAASSDNTSPIENSLTKALKGTRIRSLLVDSLGRLWISTSGAGVWCVHNLNDIEIFNSENGMPGDKFRCVLELSDGTMCIGGDTGIAFISMGKVQRTITAAEGLRNPKILCLCEPKPGVILAGTDGNGIAVIENKELKKHLYREDGLTSEVILRLVITEDFGNVMAVTGSGLCRLSLDNGKITPVTSFPYRNNYDLIEYRDKFFVLSSAGIYVVDKQDVLEDNVTDYLLLNTDKGLENMLTPNSRNFIDEENNLYMSTDCGAVCMNLDDYSGSDTPYVVRLKEIKTDDEQFVIHNDERIILPRTGVRLELTPEIVNYTPNDPPVSFYLKGFDESARILPQSKLGSIVYTNLPSGEYTLYLNVMDSKGKAVASMSYTFEKEMAIYDNDWFIAYVVIIFALLLIYLSWLVIRAWYQRHLKIQQQQLELVNRQIQMSNETIITIARAVDAKDKNTSQHSQRVAEYSVLIAEKLGFTPEQKAVLKQTALLHDIGKISIPDNILNKPSRLTDEEYAIMKNHVVAGAEILRDFTTISSIADGALYHHERYDGKGYVHGLKGEEIPLNARIIGIADAFDAMTANRVYRKKLDFDYVLGELEKGKGSQFDPYLADVMLDLIHSGEINAEELYKSTEEKSESITQ